MHMFSKENNFYGGHGIVGAQVPIGTGIAFTHKYNGDKNICRTYIGDGAMNNGQVFEAFNLAALWELPVLYIIENNKYGMGTSQERHAAGELYKRGEAYGIPGEKVNGMDVLKVREAALKAVDYVRDGNGPVLMECNTYRYRGHSMSDPAKYRTREEVQDVREHKDPIEGIKKLLLENGSTEDELKAIDKDIRKTVTQAADFAESSPEPEAGELYTDVLVGEY